MIVKVERNPEQTKQVILEAAFKEVHQHGFQATSIDAILANTGLTKGALYHHFPNKTALGYALIEHVVAGYMKEQWVEPLAAYENPIDGIQKILGQMGDEMTSEDLALGCPLNNLNQEMSSVDEGFRERLKSIYELWSGSISNALKKGQEKGYVRKSVNPEKAAVFLVAAMEGCIGIAKNAQSIKLLNDCSEGVLDYLETLRA